MNKWTFTILYFNNNAGCEGMTWEGADQMYVIACFMGMCSIGKFLIAVAKETAILFVQFQSFYYR